MYNEIVSARFQNLKNAGMVANADAVGQVGSVGSGDMIKIYLRITNGVITDAKFKTMGSVYSLVACDLLCDMLKNCTVENALLIKSDDIIKALGGLPTNKMHLVELLQSVVIDAMEYYQKKLSKENSNTKKK